MLNKWAIMIGITGLIFAVPVDMGRIEAQIQNALEAQLQGKPYRYEITVMNHPAMSWMDTSYQVTIDLPKTCIGMVIVPVTLLDKNRQAKTFFQASVKVYDTVLVAQQNILRKQAMSEIMLGLAEKEITSYLLSNKKVYSQTNAIAGQRSKTYFKPGDVIVSDRIEAIPDILKDQSVTLTAAKNDIEISLPVKALEEGFIGDMIKVLNIKSKRILTAKIESKDAVVMMN